jgi:hypothetical protein
VHGFTLARWADGVPLPCTSYDREALLCSLSRYLTLLARGFRVYDEPRGASLDELFRMCTHNALQLLGDAAARELEPYRQRLLHLSERARPVAIDGKLDRHEWLVLREGHVQKTDALDHHLGHDLIGCQDIAWDVAGAKVELDLRASELDRLLASLRDGAGVRLEPLDLRFYELAYLCFSAGHASLARLALSACAPAEAARMMASTERYTQKLAEVLFCTG